MARIREAVFGVQDGLISTVALLSSIFGAVTDKTVVVIAGLAAALAGMVSMSVGSYLGSNAEREAMAAEIERARAELQENPAKEYAALVAIYEREGLSQEEATEVANHISNNSELWLRTVVEKELGLNPDLPADPKTNAMTMGASFISAAIVPIIPYFFLEGYTALITSIGTAALFLFTVGVTKSRFTGRNPIASGLQILIIGVASAIAGYALGVLLPRLLANLGIG
jgi:VIT1/CCC1 family predicted Fe2+/Mn2+ transporter